MKPGPRALLCVPGEAGRELWRLEPGGEWKKVVGQEPDGAAIFAIEAVALDSVPFWAVAPQDGKADVSAVAALKWETLGAGDAEEGKAWTHWDAGSFENRVLVASAGLAADLPEPPWQGRMPASFELSPRLFPIPSDEAAIWCELGRLVIAFMRRDRLAHFCVLSSRRLDADAAQEIHDLLLGLEVQGFIGRPAGLRVWTAAEPGFAEALKERPGLVVRQEDKPAPALPAAPCDLFPPDVAIARKTRQQRRRTAQLVGAVAALYVLFFAGWGGWLFWRAQSLAKHGAEISRRRPEIEEIRALQTRWEMLSQATNADAFPTELFHRVVSLLPDEGIRLKEFFIEQDRLVVGGEASTIGLAKKLQADLTGNAGLKQYTWNFPQPTILEDNRASFRAEGALITGGDGS